MNEEAIFAAALEKQTGRERQTFLDEVCAGDSKLRSRVEELLKADSDAGSFLNHTPAGLDATVVTDSGRASAHCGEGKVSLPFLAPCEKPDRIGKLTGKVGEYEIIEVVGQGGMGAVLRAFDTKLSRIVAVKIMAPELAANPTAVKRFLREAQTAAAIHHDHVVTIHAIDDSHRPPYIVMEFIDGQTLQQKIDSEGGLDLKKILRIGSQMAAGLAAAHKHGLIHRDVKPANILLENGVERVKITDFGLARAADDMEMTTTGMIAGTPQYMSPEQAKGEPIDTRSDLFSLGSVLYTMCTGRPAFRAETTMGALRRVCEDIPRPIHEVNAEIPEWLEAIVNKLLAKDPADRFQTASEVGELLSQHLAYVQNPALAPRPAAVGAMDSAMIASKVASATQPAIPPQPFWLWGTNLLLMVAVMFVSLLTLVFRIDTRLMAPIGAAVTWLWLAAMVYRIYWHRMQVNRMNTVGTEHRSVLNQGVFIEHPVLGAVAIFMLIVSVGIAYMLTSAWQRSPANRPSEAGPFSWNVSGIEPIFSGLMLSFVVATVGWMIVTQIQRKRARRESASAALIPRPALLLDANKPPPAAELTTKSAQHWRWWQWGILGAGVLLNAWWFGPPLVLTARNQASLTFEADQPEAQLILAGPWTTLSVDRQQPHLFIVPGTYRLEIAPPPGQSIERLTYYHRTLFTGHYETHASPTAREIYIGRGDRVKFRAAFHRPRAAEAPGVTAGSPRIASAPPLAIAPFNQQKAKEHQEACSKHLGVPVEITNSIGMKLRLIPPGRYESDSSAGAQSAEPFFLGTSEVTVGEFRRFVDETSHQTTGEKSLQGGSRVQSAKKTERRADYVWSHPEFAASADHPVTQVTWHDATAFCEWLSRKEGRTYRLPREGEWQWAVRAGSATRFYFGEALSDSDAHAWHLGNANDRAQPVRSKLPNPWGLYDMYGNVWELTYDFERNETAIDPAQAKDGPKAADRINFWGGSFNGPPEAPPVRGFGPALVPYSHLGFRVAIVGDLKAKAKTTTASPSTATLPADGWTPLFNGQDLVGWKTHPSQPGFWKVEEGQLVGFGAPSHLFSERGDYGDFHLRVEAQINDGGSSGVYFRVPEFAASRYGQFPDGYEANINSTFPTDTDRTGSLTGSLRGVAPYKNSLHKPDEWFTLEVLAEGQRIVIQVNGQTTVDFVDANNTFRRGHLALQVWPAQTVVRFRKIEIKELASNAR